MLNMPLRAIQTPSDLQMAVRDTGSYFFERETMAFFHSRLHDVRRISETVCLAITSERSTSASRRYTVRRFEFVPVLCKRDGQAEYWQTWNVQVSEPFGFMAFETLADARKAFRSY